MSQISAHVRLRPIRFGFLVRPDDGVRLQTIFEVNTCLWGGMYNPIIPFLETVPDWWERDGFQLETASQIMDGYIDFFEPDFLVEAEPGLATRFGFEKERVLQIQEILPVEGDWERKGNGLSVYDLYAHLYRTEFQFARRHQHHIIDPVPEQEYAQFCACSSILSQSRNMHNSAPAHLAASPNNAN